jgi:hypothetical protein
MGGWVGGRESRVKYCLQQSKIVWSSNEELLLRALSPTSRKKLGQNCCRSEFPGLICRDSSSILKFRPASVFSVKNQV